MKKELYILLLIIITSTFVFINSGCDVFNNFPINIPVSKSFAAYGNSSTVSGSGPICLNEDSPTYRDYKDKIKSLTFIQAAFRFDSVIASGISAPNLKGDFIITVSGENYSELFSIKINNINPTDYINKAYVLPLNQNQSQSINSYISNLNNTCLLGKVEISNITGGNSPFLITGVIDMVFEADTEL